MALIGKKKTKKRFKVEEKGTEFSLFNHPPPIDVDTVKGGGWVGKGGENSRFAFGSDTKHLCRGGCRETSHDFTFVHPPSALANAQFTIRIGLCRYIFFVWRRFSSLGVCAR